MATATVRIPAEKRDILRIIAGIEKTDWSWAPVLGDFDDDGHLDVVFSNADRYLACIFSGMQEGWSRKTLDGKQGSQNGLPMIVRADGTNNGAWFKYGQMWVQNEDVASSVGGQVGNPTEDHLTVSRRSDLLF